MYSEFEQDLILACKNWYGQDGVEKVICDYVGYSEINDVGIEAKYHFIAELYTKLCKNEHLKYKNLLDRLSPNRIYDHKKMVPVNRGAYTIYSFSQIVCDHMIAEIQGMCVKDDTEIIIELHAANEKFIEEEQE